MTFDCIVRGPEAPTGRQNLSIVDRAGHKAKNRNQFSMTCGLKYEPLKGSRWVRLLRILPTPNSAYQYEASLIAVSLDHSITLPWYTTLSYAWGGTFADGSHLTERFRCDDGELWITKNLRQALDSICKNGAAGSQSSDNSSFFLWADSICINQADRDERNTQVALMPEIYAKCHDMIVWLGQYSDETWKWLANFYALCPDFSEPMSSKNVLSELQRYMQPFTQDRKDSICRLLFQCPGELPPLWNALFLSKERQIIPSFWRTVVPEVGESRREFRSSLAPRAKDVQARRSYAGLIQRDWFHRKWVIQEMAQTRNKHCVFLVEDQAKILDDITDAARQSSIEIVNTPLEAQMSGETLLQNLRRYRHTDCSDPHDHIYALLGLSSDVSWLSVDYNTSTEDLYSTVAEYYITNGECVVILALATAQQSLADLPSWVPDWRRTEQCERSATHTDLMTTISKPARKLSQRKYDNDIPCLITPQANGSKALSLGGWLISECLPYDKHESLNCKKCKILNNTSGSARYSKQPMRQAMLLNGSSASLLTSRVAAAHMKWAGVIQEQFEAAMHTDEVLLLIEDSAIGFVLLPMSGDLNLSDTHSYRLQFCFQVDEEGWVTKWFANALGKESKEWICIVR